MKKLIYLALLIFATIPAFAVTGTDVQLLASTLPGVTPGRVGQLDTTIPQQLIFRVPNQPDLNMPYAQITEFSSRQEVTHHLGVLPAIAVGLIAARRHSHFLSITFTDANGTPQIATFEVAKDAVELLRPVLLARARQACERKEFGACIPIVPVPRQPLKP